MRTGATLATLALGLLLAAGANAEECVPTTSSPEVDTLGAGSQALGHTYVDIDFCWPASCNTIPFVMWIYFETNGLAGLQRADSLHDDTCGGAIESDTNSTPS